MGRVESTDVYNRCICMFAGMVGLAHVALLRAECKGIPAVVREPFRWALLRM
jgi:hypothetical protein